MTEVDLSIFDANIKDLGELRKLEEICFPIDRWPLLDLIGVLTLPAIVRKKAVYQGQFAGFIAGDIRRSQGFGMITTIAVFPNYRGLGIAKKMLLICENEMAVSKIMLTVRKSNTSAINLYLASGYTQKEIWEKYYIGGEDGIVFEKTVDFL